MNKDEGPIKCTLFDTAVQSLANVVIVVTALKQKEEMHRKHRTKTKWPVVATVAISYD